MSLPIARLEPFRPDGPRHRRHGGLLRARSGYAPVSVCKRSRRARLRRPEGQPPRGRSRGPAECATSPGSADVCFICDTPLRAVVEHLEGAGVEVELGPTGADGAQGPLDSVWLRDPDGNLIELSNLRSGQ